MQTLLSAKFADSSRGLEAERILRKCVHCGFCNATCPTYQLLGDELDGPRGRIYQMKLIFEGAEPTKKMQQHLDRCLTCRSCESTCPSGVQYSKLLEIGREVVDEQVSRDVRNTLLRKVLTTIVPNRNIFSLLIGIGKLFRSILPSTISNKIPTRNKNITPLTGNVVSDRKMVMLAGCAQPALTPGTNIAARNLLNRMGIELIEVKQADCCGAVCSHTSEPEKGRLAAQRLIDTWYPYLLQGFEAFVMTASGCGVTIKEYPHLFADNPVYLEKAIAISERTYDLCEIIEQEMSTGYELDPIEKPKRVAFHPPCTLQHGQKVNGKVEKILKSAGYELLTVNDSHLCCGSAGSYSILQPKIANVLRENKLSSLEQGKPDVICTANVGCQSWLQMNSKLPMVHWVELLI